MGMHLGYGCSCIYLGMLQIAIVGIGEYFIKILSLFSLLPHTLTINLFMVLEYFIALSLRASILGRCHGKG